MDQLAKDILETPLADLQDAPGPSSRAGPTTIRRAPGRPGAKLTATVVGELTAQDLELYNETEGPIYPAPTLQRVRASHHRLAMVLAKGSSDIEASQITGYSPGRINGLKSDPSFQDLLTYYEKQAEGAFGQVINQMATLSLDAMQELLRRLDENPDEFKTEELLKLATNMLDRTGHGPQQKVERTDRLDPDSIRALKEAANRESKGVVIDAQSYQPTDGGETSGQSPESGMGEGQEEGEGLSEERPHVRAISGPVPQAPGSES